MIFAQGLEDPEAVGEDYNVDEAEDGPRPFTALLDTGLKRTSTGSKVFAAMKVHPLPLPLPPPPLPSAQPPYFITCLPHLHATLRCLRP